MSFILNCHVFSLSAVIYEISVICNIPGCKSCSSSFLYLDTLQIIQIVRRRSATGPLSLWPGPARGQLRVLLSLSTTSFLLLTAAFLRHVYSFAALYPTLPRHFDKPFQDCHGHSQSPFSPSLLLGPFQGNPDMISRERARPHFFARVTAQDCDLCDRWMLLVAASQQLRPQFRPFQVSVVAATSGIASCNDSKEYRLNFQYS